MLTLFHHPLSPHSRFVRLIFGEMGEEIALIEEQPWARRREFLQLNPAGTLPVLLAEGDNPVSGATVIAEYLDETRGPMMRNRRLLSGDALERAETRRLVEWFLVKLDGDVVRHLVRERAFRPQMTAEQGGGAPDSAALRAARANIRQHLKYANWLAGSRNWMAGNSLSIADLAAAAALSVLDYMGEISWTEWPQLRDWYSRMKSRPSFRPILADRVRGLGPVSHYADLDF